VQSLFSAKKQNQSQMRFLQLPNNDGKSCYANSIVQALLQMKYLTDRLVLEDDHISQEIAEFQSLLTTTQRSFQGTHMLRSLVGEEFEKNEQQDVHDFFLKLINQLPESARRLFMFDRTYTPRCRKCHKLNLPTTHTGFCYETYPDDNDTFSNLFPESDFVLDKHCTTCKMNTTQQRYIKVTLGEEQKYLVVLLNLFKYNKLLKKQSRMSERIIGGFNSANIVRLFGKTFTTIAAIRHQGETTKKGHYTCCIRSDDGWFEISDSLTTEFISKRFVQKLNNVYMLFLERV
jgi:ubiquitin C-terminal hydrolase